jgi:hypothetical protein
VNGRRATSRLAGAAQSARSGYDRAIDLLERLVPIASRLERVVRFYGYLVVAAALVIVATLLAVDVPGTVWTWGALIALLLVLLIAPAVILVFASMLREALRLPSQFRTLPDLAPARARELGALAREARDWRRREQVGSIPRDTWRAGRLLNALRKEIPGVSVLLSIARIPFMIAVAIAMLVGVFEVMLAPVVVATALISSVI